MPERLGRTPAFPTQLSTHTSSQVLNRKHKKPAPQKCSTSTASTASYLLSTRSTPAVIVKYTHPLLPVKLSARHKNPKPSLQDQFYVNGSSESISRPDLSAILLSHSLLSAELQQLRRPPEPGLQPERPHQLHSMHLLVMSQPLKWASSRSRHPFPQKH